jgi:hypothetical protein
MMMTDPKLLLQKVRKPEIIMFGIDNNGFNYVIILFHRTGLIVVDFNHPSAASQCSWRLAQQ